MAGRAGGFLLAIFCCEEWATYPQIIRALRHKRSQMKVATLQKMAVLTIIVTTIIELYLALKGYGLFVLNLCLGAPAIGAAFWFLLLRWKPWRSHLL